MGFDPYNRPLKIWESIMTPTSKMGSSLGSVKVDSLTLFGTPRNMSCDSRASLLARNLASLYFGREPKARVAIMLMPRSSYLGKV
jgi:hypothetical protein